MAMDYKLLAYTVCKTSPKKKRTVQVDVGGDDGVNLAHLTLIIVVAAKLHLLL